MKKPPIFVAVMVVWMGLFLIATTGKAEVLVVKKVSTTPVIDGNMEQLWNSAQPVSVKVSRIPERIEQKNRSLQKGKYRKNWKKADFSNVSEVELRALYTDTEIFFLARWKDETKNDSHKPYIWDSTERVYKKSKEKEDRIAFRFPISGEYSNCMLEIKKGTYRVDLWQWKAWRTNPIGIIHDKYHEYSYDVPKGKYSIHYTAEGKEIYVKRVSDGGKSPYRKNRIDPFTYQGKDTIPSYIPQKPDAADALDVKAKGQWKDGYWTVEIGRKLDTGHHETDTVFVPGREMVFNIAVFDHNSDHFHNISGPITLRFE